MAATLTTPKTLTALAAALMLALAGCSGATGPATDAGTDANVNDGSGDAETTQKAATTVAPTGEDVGSDGGTIDFYLSDDPGAIQDFQHLNVTITTVGIKRAGDGNESGWLEYDVDDKTADLTTLLGPNSTKLGVLDAPPGNYTKVFVYVDGIDATLENGEQVTVKLPSNKLQLDDDFTVGPNSSLDFVFDISVFEAGNSGKYILKPVVSQSGTGEDVEIKDVDEKEEENESEDEREDESDEESEDETEESGGDEADEEEETVETTAAETTTPPEDDDSNEDVTAAPPDETSVPMNETTTDA
jgi:hypothetical protein